MGSKSRNRKYYPAAAVFIFFIFLTVSLEAQQKSYAAGISGGICSFESLSASVSGINLSASFEFPVWFSRAFNFQASIFYIRKTEFFLPEDEENYYPLFYGASLSGIMRQKINTPFFVEEQAGVMVLRNNFFRDISETNYGIIFGAAGGFDLRTPDSNGFLISLGYKGGITFNGSTPSFNSFLLQGNYFF